MHIYDIVAKNLLDNAVEARLVNASESDVYGRPLTVWKYSKAAQIQGDWNEATINLRGVVTEKDGTVLARGFKKFFNWSEQGGPHIPQLKTSFSAIEVMDKADGSAILAWFDPVLRKWCCTTLGSLSSEQGSVGRELLEAADTSGLDPAYSYMFELISPRARCVIDYKGLEGLMLLGKVSLDGNTVPLSSVPTSEWGGMRAEIFSYTTIEEVLSHLNRPSAEGYVVHFLDTDERVKMKQEDYVTLHRIIFGVSTLSVWEHLRSGGSIEDLVKNLPEEFEPWVRECASELKAKKYALENSILTAASFILTEKDANPAWSRKDLALRVQKEDPELQGWLWSVIDNRMQSTKTQEKLWDKVRPAYEKVVV